MKTVSTPWHLWVIAGLAAFWAGIVLVDRGLMIVEYQPYLALSGDLELETYARIPKGWEVFSLVSTACGFLGAVMLLLRRRFAVNLLLIDVIGFGIYLPIFLYYGYGGGGQTELAINSTAGALGWLLTLGIWYYARRMAARGVLN